VNKNFLKSLYNDLKKETKKAGLDIDRVNKEVFARVIPRHVNFPVDESVDLLFQLCDADGTFFFCFPLSPLCWYK
jgi:hypothetical protein